MSSRPQEKHPVEIEEVLVQDLNISALSPHSFQPSFCSSKGSGKDCLHGWKFPLDHPPPPHPATPPPPPNKKKKRTFDKHSYAARVLQFEVRHVQPDIDREALWRYRRETLEKVDTHGKRIQQAGEPRCHRGAYLSPDLAWTSPWPMLSDPHLAQVLRNRF